MTMTDPQPALARTADRPALAIGTIEATRLVLEAQGDFSRTDVPLIRQRIAELANAGVRNFIVEVGPTSSFSVDARRELKRLAEELARSGGSLRMEDRSQLSTVR